MNIKKTADPKTFKNSTRIKINDRLLLFFLFLLFIMFIIKPDITFESAKNGLTLWADSVLPGIFPAMIITTCILSLCPMGKSSKYLYVTLCGLLCGYPLGAILCSRLHAETQNETVSNALMAYCNLSSPSFVINYIFRMTCFQGNAVWQMLFCVYAPAIEGLAVLMFIHRKKIFSKSRTVTAANAADNPPHSQNGVPFIDVLDRSIWQSIHNLLKLGGYIVLFACISGFVTALPAVNPSCKAGLCSLLEITNGISLLDKLRLSASGRILFILTINAFGGISTIMQTMGMIQGSGLSIKKYIYHKLVFAALTAANTALMIYVLPV